MQSEPTDAETARIEHLRLNGSATGVTAPTELAAVIDVACPTEGRAGEIQSHDDPDRTRLQTLFEDVTGTTKIVTSQDTTAHGRSVVDADHESLSTAVADVVQEDGLDDTLAEPQGDQH